MLVIADRDRAVAVAGVMGGAASEVSSRDDASRARERVVSSAERSARPAGKLGLKTEASMRFERGADIGGARGSARPRRRGHAREIGAGRARGRRDRRLPDGRDAEALDVCDARASPPAGRCDSGRGGRADPRRRWASSSSRPSEGWDVDGADVPRRRAARSRSHRGSRPALGLRSHSGDVPRPSSTSPRAVGPRRRARTADSPRPLRRRTAGSRHVHVHGAAAAAPFAAAGDLVAITNPLSEKFAVLRPSLVARPGRLAASTTATGRPPTSGCSRSGPLFSLARRTAAVSAGC